MDFLWDIKKVFFIENNHISCNLYYLPHLWSNTSSPLVDLPVETLPMSLPFGCLQITDCLALSPSLRWYLWLCRVFHLQGFLIFPHNRRPDCMIMGYFLTDHLYFFSEFPTIMLHSGLAGWIFAVQAFLCYVLGAYKEVFRPSHKGNKIC